MRVRKALPSDIPAALELARSLGVEYPDMGSDRLWVADEDGRVIGVVALKEHPDGLELCGLGVDRGFRGRGVGQALVEALWAEASGDVHLMTVIPEFFAGCGFVKADAPLKAFFGRLGTAWCEGCDRTFCTVMVRQRP